MKSGLFYSILMVTFITVVPVVAMDKNPQQSAFMALRHTVSSGTFIPYSNEYMDTLMSPDASETLFKPTTLVALLGGVGTAIISVATWKWWADSALDVSKTAVDAASQSINNEKKKLEVEQRRLAIQEQRNDEALELLGAVEGLSLKELHTLAQSEEKTNSERFYFRQRYQQKLLEKKRGRETTKEIKTKPVPRTPSPSPERAPQGHLVHHSPKNTTDILVDDRPIPPIPVII